MFWSKLSKVLGRSDERLLSVSGGEAVPFRVGNDVLFGVAGVGIHSASRGRDLVIGRDGVAEALNGGRGADVILAQSGDRVRVQGRDTIVLEEDGVAIQGSLGALARMRLVVPGFEDPVIAGIDANGVVTVRDAAAIEPLSLTFTMFSPDGAPVAGASWAGRWLSRRLDPQGDDALARLGVAYDGAGTDGDDVLRGGVEIDGGAGRDVLIASAETTVMRGGEGGDLLLLDTPGRGVMLDGGRGVREGGAPGVDAYVITGFGQAALDANGEECVIWDLINGSTGEVNNALGDSDIWNVLSDTPEARAAFERIAALQVDYLLLPEFDGRTTEVRYGGEGLLIFTDATGLSAQIRFATSDGRFYDEDEIVYEFAVRVFVGEDTAPLTAEQFLIDMSVAGLLGRIGEAAFASTDDPAPSTREGADLIIGGGDGGRGGDLLIGRQGVAERLDGGLGGDLVIAQGGDTVVVDTPDTVVLREGVGDDARVFTLEAPFLEVRDLTYVLPEITVVLPDFRDPQVATVSRRGVITIEDRDGATAEIRLLDGDGGRPRLSNRQIEQLTRDLTVEGADSPALEGVAFDGVGTDGDDLLIGGVRMAAGAGRDLLVAEAETVEMVGGSQDDLLIAEGGIMMTGGAGIDLYVLTDSAPTAGGTTDPGCLLWDLVDGSAVGGDAAAADPDCDIWDVFGSTISGTTNSMAYLGDALWLTDLDAATTQATLRADGAFVFKDARGRSEAVMFESAEDGSLLGRDDLDQLVDRVFAGAEGVALEVDQFILF